MGEPPVLSLDPRLARALSHPLRVRLLAVLNERVASPVEVSKLLDEPLQNVAYHARALLELGCIELVATVPRRGALEHYYRAVMRPFFGERDWARLPKSARQAVSDVVLQMVWDDTATALENGAFDNRVDRHLSRTVLAVDDEGWEKLTALLAETLAAAIDIQEESAARLAAGGEPLDAEVVLMNFTAAASG